MGKIGEFSYETFNAASAKIKINGRSVHPGTAKGRLKNAIQVAIDFHNLLPVFDRAEHTEGRGRLYSPMTEMAGEAEELIFITSSGSTTRQHSRGASRKCSGWLTSLMSVMVRARSSEIRDQYFNMRKMIEARPEIIEIARKAYRAAGARTRGRGSSRGDGRQPALLYGSSHAEYLHWRS